MKVALCTHISLSYGGGGEKWCWTVARYLRDHGYDVTVYSLPYAPEERRVVKSEEVLAGIPYHESWFNSVDADVAYIFYNPLAYFQFICDCPRIAGVHTNLYFLERDPPITYGGATFFFSRLLYKAIGRVDLSLYDAVHLVNDLWRVRHRRVFNIPNFVDTDRYRPLADKLDTFTVLFSGRPTWVKGWDTFLDTAVLSKRKGLDLDFVWAGGADERYKQYLRGLGYISSEAKMAGVYSSSHVLLQPSRSEGGRPPLSVLESLGCGTPAIVTSLKTYESLRLPLIYASSPEEILDRILWVREMWEEGGYQEFSCECRKSVEGFSKKKILPRIEDMFREVSRSDV